MSYIQGFLVAVPKGNKQAYLESAQSAAPIFKEYGATRLIISLPGVTGYIQMGSYQTAELAAQGFVVVTLNQPGAVAAAVCPLVATFYRTTGQALPDDLAQKLAPEKASLPTLQRKFRWFWTSWRKSMPISSTP